ncbi:phosphatase PAP2 family protein [Leucobacter albus]|uniref:Phosphatase PAP2 family protein n=1 Tax=Leucobacter albus TaxID=272210 RepID=A0ABW3TME2_9MICO
MTSKPAAPSVAWAILGIIAVAALGAYLHFGASGPLPLDEAWREAARLTPGSVAFTVAAFMAEIGSAVGVAACGAVACALLLTRQFGREAAALATALVLGVALSELAKALVARPRPIDALYAWDGYSFPSGHSMGAAALAVSVAYAVTSVYRRGATFVTRASVTWIWIAAVCWTLAMMWSRTALGVHWLSDTVAGAILGICAALIAQRIWRPRGVRRGR